MKHLAIAIATVLVSTGGCLVPSAEAFARSDLKGPHHSNKKDHNREALLLELTGKDLSKLDDRELYAEIFGAFQQDDEIGLKSRTQSLLSRFPQSEYADNALYLAGMISMNHHDYANSLKYFTQIEQIYPNGNKAVSARFAKAMTYRKMNLDGMAKEVLNEVKQKFPGSPESYRAENELKLIK